MKLKRSVPVRMPSKAYDELDNALQVRFKNNLISRRDMKLTEGLRLISRTPEWHQAIKKLKTEPRKEDMNGNLF
jgi:hypothetical protein